jgi:hypothetical protein
VSIDEIRSLVTERQRYDDWLTALEARRAETPARVFDRVLQDYVARRDGVLSQLRKHVGGLTALGDELEGKREVLESQLAALDDERVEAMLRTAVGEYDQEHWNVVRQDVEAKIGVLGEHRASLLAEIAEIRTLLSSARHEPATVEQGLAAALAAVDLPEPIPAESEPIQADLIQAESIQSESLEAIELDTAAIDGIEIELDEPPAPVPPAPETVAPETVAPEVDDGFDDLAFLRSGTAPAPVSSNAASPSPAGASPSEPLKTLRCTECSTMNLPTEWYCERCGGELAAF